MYAVSDSITTWLLLLGSPASDHSWCTQNPAWTTGAAAAAANAATNLISFPQSLGSPSMHPFFFSLSAFSHIRVAVVTAGARGSVINLDFSFTGVNTAQNLMTTSQNYIYSGPTFSQWVAVFGIDRTGNPVFQRNGDSTNSSLSSPRSLQGCGQPIIFGWQANNGPDDVSSGLGASSTFCGGGYSCGFASGDWMSNGIGTLNDGGVYVFGGLAPGYLQTLFGPQPPQPPSPPPSPFPPPQPPSPPPPPPAASLVSCNTILAANQLVADGLYTLSSATTAGSAVTSYSAWCDMTNGGWELVMRVSTSSQLAYSSQYWTSGSLLNPDASGGPFVNQDAIFTGYTSRPATSIRACLGTGSSCFVTSPLLVPPSASSTRPVFSSLQWLFANMPLNGAESMLYRGVACSSTTYRNLTGSIPSTTAWFSPSVWPGPVPVMSGWCTQWFVANFQDYGSSTFTWNSKMRIGMALNNECNQEGTSDYQIGLGTIDQGAGVSSWDGSHPISSQQGSLWVGGRP